MSNLKQANVRYEYLPAHKYIGIWEPNASNYGEFWRYHDCDKITGLVESMRHEALEVVGNHMPDVPKTLPRSYGLRNFKIFTSLIRDILYEPLFSKI